MNHILGRITDLMTINRRIEHQTETISQLADRIRIRNISLRQTIDLNLKITFLRVSQVVRKKTTTHIRTRGITTIQERINGAVNLTWSIRDQIHMKVVLALILNRQIQGHRLRTIRKTLIKIRHRTLRMVKSIRKTLMNRLVIIVVRCYIDIDNKNLTIYRVSHHVSTKNTNILEMNRMIDVTMHRTM